MRLGSRLKPCPLPPWGFIRLEKLTNSFENNLDLSVIPDHGLFKRFQFDSQIFMPGEYSSQAYKGSNHLDAQSHHSRRSKNAGRHHGSVFCEGVRSA